MEIKSISFKLDLYLYIRFGVIMEKVECKSRKLFFSKINGNKIDKKEAILNDKYNDNNNSDNNN